MPMLRLLSTDRSMFGILMIRILAVRSGLDRATTATSLAGAAACWRSKDSCRGSSRFRFRCLMTAIVRRWFSGTAIFVMPSIVSRRGMAAKLRDDFCRNATQQSGEFRYSWGMDVADLESLPARMADLERQVMELRRQLTTKPPESLLDTDAAAKLLGVTPSALRMSAYRGSVPCVRMGRRLRFRASELVR